MRSQNVLTFVAALTAAALLYGCGSGGNAAPAGDQVVSTIPLGGKVVTDNPTVMPWTEFRSVAKGTVVGIRLNRQGTVVTEYEAVVDGFDESNSERLVIVRMKPVFDAGGRDVTPMVGEGDSGSPVIYHGQIVAVLCYGMVSGDNLTFGARAVEDVVKITGAIGRGAGQQINSRYKLIGLSRMNTMNRDSQTSETSRSTRQATNLIPGMSITALELNGPVLFGATGTISYIDGQNMYAFGHMFNMNGANTTPVYLAEMNTLGGGVGSQAAAKLYSVTGQAIGTLTNDGFCGIKIEKDAPAKTYPVTVRLKIDGQQRSDLVGQLASHDWQTIGGGWTSYSEPMLIEASVNWIVWRAMGKVTGAYTDGTFAIKYAGENETMVPFGTDQPPLKPGTTPAESTDVSYDVSGWVGGLLRVHARDWASPESVTVTASITTGSKQLVYASIIDGAGNMIGFGGSTDPVHLIQTTDPGDMGYYIKAHVPGWSNYSVSVTVTDQSVPDVLTLTGNNIKATNLGTATIHVTVTNTKTGTSLDLNPPFSIMVDPAFKG